MKYLKNSLDYWIEQMTNAFEGADDEQADMVYYFLMIFYVYYTLDFIMMLL